MLITLGGPGDLLARYELQLSCSVRWVLDFDSQWGFADGAIDDQRHAMTACGQGDGLGFEFEGLGIEPGGEALSVADV